MGRWCFSAGTVTKGLHMAEVNVSPRSGLSPAGWLTRDRGELRAQRSLIEYGLELPDTSPSVTKLQILAACLYSDNFAVYWCKNGGIESSRQQMLSKMSEKQNGQIAVVVCFYAVCMCCSCKRFQCGVHSQSVFVFCWNQRLGGELLCCVYFFRCCCLHVIRFLAVKYRFCCIITWQFSPKQTCCSIICALLSGAIKHLPRVWATILAL